MAVTDASYRAFPKCGGESDRSRKQKLANSHESRPPRSRTVGRQTAEVHETDALCGIPESASNSSTDASNDIGPHECQFVPLPGQVRTSGGDEFSRGRGRGRRRRAVGEPGDGH